MEISNYQGECGLNLMGSCHLYKLPASLSFLKMPSSIFQINIVDLLSDHLSTEVSHFLLINQKYSFYFNKRIE